MDTHWIVQRDSIRYRCRMGKPPPVLTQAMQQVPKRALPFPLAMPLITVLLVAACANGHGSPSSSATGDATHSSNNVSAAANPAALDAGELLDRISWGATPTEYAQIRAVGTARWLEAQLHPDEHAPLAPSIEEQIAGMTIERTPLPQLVYTMESQHKSADGIQDDEAKKAAQHDYQQEMNRLAREAATRGLLRDLYSPKQLQEQMTWFWFNHFNVHQHKGMIRAMLGDYEEQLRAHALGHFRDLLAVTAHHPAMLAYLDNAQNAVNHINENYARELLELHSLGVDAGYTQKDVQELARVLTGFGVNHNDPAQSDPPKLKKDHAGDYVRVGLFEFNPNRHDYGDKLVLGTTIHGRGPAELEQVLDIISRHPATARNVSRKLARYFVADDPAPALVESMADEFTRTNGDIAAVLRVAFASPQFAASLHRDFKDPVHYVVSAVRLAYDTKPIVNANPMVNWLNRLGEGPYNHQTPDGYSLSESAWDGPGQMAVRFEIAKAIGQGSAGLFRTEGPNPSEKPAFPQLANAMFYESTQRTLAPTTLQALDQAVSPQEWNLLLLSSPEFMMR
jgi:uncharacterized protein (DUF1800 family)